MADQHRVEGDAAPDPFVEVTHGDIAFDATSDFWLDIAEFERHFGRAAGGDASEPSQIAALEAAVDAYRGDFLAGFYDKLELHRATAIPRSDPARIEPISALRKATSYPTASSPAGSPCTTLSENLPIVK